MNYNCLTCRHWEGCSGQECDPEPETRTITCPCCGYESEVTVGDEVSVICADCLDWFAHDYDTRKAFFEEYGFEEDGITADIEDEDLKLCAINDNSDIFYEWLLKTGRER